MTLLRIILLATLLICAAAVSFSRNLLISIIIYMTFSLVMAIVWLVLQSPDLAITEAAVGAGVASILFFVTLKKIHLIHISDEQPDDAEPVPESGGAEKAAFTEEVSASCEQEES